MRIRAILVYKVLVYSVPFHISYFVALSAALTSKLILQMLCTVMKYLNIKYSVNASANARGD
jgi:hypothetical protein